MPAINEVPWPGIEILKDGKLFNKFEKLLRMGTLKLQTFKKKLQKIKLF